MKKIYFLFSLFFIQLAVNAQVITDYVSFSYLNGVVTITKLPSASIYNITCDHYLNTQFENNYVITTTPTVISLLPILGTNEFYLNVQLIQDGVPEDENPPLRIGPATVDDIDSKVLTMNADALGNYMIKLCDPDYSYDYVATINSIHIDKLCICSFLDEMYVNPYVLDLYTQQYVWEAFYDEWATAILSLDMIDFCTVNSIPYRLAKPKVDAELQADDYQIFDMMGKEIDKSSTFSTGIYIMKENKNGDRKTYKYIVE